MDARYKIQDARCKMQDARCKLAEYFCILTSHACIDHDVVGGLDSLAASCIIDDTL